MTTRPSDPDGWYDPDKPPRAAVRDKTEDWDKRKATEARIAELEAEIARLTAINADLCAVNLNHAEESTRIAELEATLTQERRTYASVADQLKARIAELEGELRLAAAIRARPEL